MAFFLFVAFKSGFVRHDIHALIGGCSVLLAAILTAMLFVDRTIVIALAFSFIAWFSMDKNHVKTSTYSVYDNLSNVYLGLWERPPFTHARRHFLHHQFDHDLGEITQESPVPETSRRGRYLSRLTSQHSRVEEHMGSPSHFPELYSLHAGLGGHERRAFER